MQASLACHQYSTKKSSTMSPMWWNYIGFHFGLAVEGKGGQYHPKHGGTYLLEKSRPFQPCIEITLRNIPFRCYCPCTAVCRGGMTFSTEAITSERDVPLCNFCADSSRSGVSWQLSCRTYALTPYGSKVMTWGVRTLQYQSLWSWDPTLTNYCYMVKIYNNIRE